MQVRLAGILPNSNANGPGLRKAIFSQGCSHGCPDCFNKHTWSFSGGKMVDCDEIIQETLEETYLSGVTFTGGDPFDQPEPFAYMAKAFKKSKLNIWSYTGYTWEQLLKLAESNVHIKDMINNIDVIVDGPFIKSKHSDQIEFRGSTNQRIIDVQKSLKENKVITLTQYK